MENSCCESSFGLARSRVWSYQCLSLFHYIVFLTPSCRVLCSSESAAESAESAAGASEDADLDGVCSMHMTVLIEKCRNALINRNHNGVRQLLAELADHEILVTKGHTVRLLAPVKSLRAAIRVAFPQIVT